MSDDSKVSERLHGSEEEQLLQVVRALDEATVKSHRGQIKERKQKTIEDQIASDGFSTADQTDQQLIDVLLTKPPNWTPETLNAVKEELKRRSLQKIEKKVTDRTDQQLLDMLAKATAWTPEAIAAAKVELKRRGVAFSTATPQVSQEGTQKSPTPQKPAAQIGLGGTPQKHISLSTQYMQNGCKLGGTVGFVNVWLYVTSPSNPNKGDLLDLKQDAIVFFIVFGCMVIGSGIGYISGKWLDD